MTEHGYQVVMPKLGLIMTEAQLIDWCIQNGEKIEKGETLFTMESEKSTLEIESPASGFVHQMVKAGETVLRSSTLWTDQGVDTGPLLMVSEPLDVILPKPVEVLMKDRDRFLRVVEEHQERLKAIGDWKIFPRTVELIARGSFALDEHGQVYVDGRPVPEGYRE